MNVGDVDLFGEVVRPRAQSVLAQRFIIPPFSVLSAREGLWQERKRQWIALGIKSELGRGENALGMSEEAGEPGLTTIGTGKKNNAIPGGAGRNSVVRDMGKNMRSRGADMTRSGALMPVSGGDVKAQFLKARGYE